MRPSQTSPTDPDDSAESQSRANRLTDGPGIAYLLGALAAVWGLVPMVHSMIHRTTGKWPLFAVLTAVVLLAVTAGCIERFRTRRGNLAQLARVLLQAIDVVTPLTVGVGWLFFGAWGTTPEDQQLFKDAALLTTIGAVTIAVPARLTSNSKSPTRGISKAASRTHTDTH